MSRKLPIERRFTNASAEREGLRKTKAASWLSQVDGRRSVEPRGKKGQVFKV